MDLKGSRTEANLAFAFAGEAQARCKYSIFAAVARREGFEQIGELFEKTAENERAHGKLWFRMLGGIGTTQENLSAAAAGEREEWTQMYRAFAETARQEGFEGIAAQFERVARIEREHEERFRQLQALVASGEVFARKEGVVWVCRNCGQLHFGAQAPEACPVCGKPQGWFELRTQNY